jgi:hypothetical protein
VPAALASACAPPALARWQHGNVQHAGQRPLERAAVVAPPPPDAVEAKRSIKSECKPRKERTARFVGRNERSGKLGSTSGGHR